MGSEMCIRDRYLTNLDVMLVYRLDRFRRGGHHRPFNQVGIPGIRIMETHEHYDRQHQDLVKTSTMIATPKENAKNINIDIEEIREATEACNSQKLDVFPDGTLKITISPNFEEHTCLNDAPYGGTFTTSEGQMPFVALYDLTEESKEYGDTMEGVDADYAAKLTALNMITMAGIAGAPPFPANVEASGAVQPSAKLVWETPDNADNLAGYRVHWRLTTEPEWTHSRFVGKVNEWTFENLVIDNYFFGVSSVAKDGSETPVVFPGAAGRF